MTRIYFSHKREQAQVLYPILKDNCPDGRTYILPHENSEEPFPVKSYLQEGRIDLVLAEVSYPATGQGIELGWANWCNIPIVCIHNSDKVSGSLKVLSNVFVRYQNLDDFLWAVEGAISIEQKKSNK